MYGGNFWGLFNKCTTAVPKMPPFHPKHVSRAMPISCSEGEGGFGGRGGALGGGGWGVRRALGTRGALGSEEGFGERGELWGARVAWGARLATLQEPGAVPLPLGFVLL